MSSQSKAFFRPYVPLGLRRFECVSKAQDEHAEMLLFGTVGDEHDGFTDRQVASFLKANASAKKITIRVNSPGGSFAQGVAIYNMLKSSSATIHARVEGWAASAAAFVTMSADKVMMGFGSRIMIHRAWTIAVGDANSLESAATLLRASDEIQTSLYAMRSGLPSASIEKMLDDETWMSADQAISMKFAHAKFNDEGLVALAGTDSQILSSFRKIPSGVETMIKAQAGKRAIHVPL